MIALTQRVKKVEVSVENKLKSRIDSGICVFLGVAVGDTSADIDYLVNRITALRFFADGSGKFVYNLKDFPKSEKAPEIMVISQFTLYADIKKGTRPSFTKAMTPAAAKILYQDFCKKLASLGYTVKEGEFGAYMAVELINDGPVTFCLSSDHLLHHHDTNTFQSKAAYRALRHCRIGEYRQGLLLDQTQRRFHFFGSIT